MLDRMLVGLDGSPLAETILPYVGALARGLNAEITLLHVAHLPEEVVSGLYQRPAIAERIARAETAARAYLAGVQDRLDDTGLRVHTAVVSGDAAGQIVFYADREGINLIVLATHGRSGLRRWRFGSVADKVLHMTRVPLLLIRPREGEPVPATGVREVVVPLDGSPLSEAVLPFAETVATRFGAPVTLLRAVQPLFLFGEPAPGSADDITVGLRETLRDYLEQPAALLRQKGITVETLPLIGDPAGEIIAHADRHPGNLIIMATEGRSGLMRMLIGSVTERVAHHAATPVLVIRPPALPVPPA